MATFMSDGGMVERAEPRVEAAIGLWEEAEKEGEFRFMVYRFVEKLTITEPKEEEEGQEEEQEGVTQTFAFIQRVRSLNHLTTNDSFEGTGMVDFLDAAGAHLLASPPAFTTTARAVRLKLVP